MTLRLTEDKANALQKLCLKVKSRNTVSIRKVAKLFGCMTASFAGVIYGPLYSKQLEVEKTHYVREKGRDLTQSYDKSPYANRNVKRAK